MKNQSSYVPPSYVPLEQSDAEAEIVPRDEGVATHGHVSNGPTQWSSGICACFDDMQSCTLLLPCDLDLSEDKIMKVPLEYGN